jgi:O-Antigen ligase
VSVSPRPQGFTLSLVNSSFVVTAIVGGLAIGALIKGATAAPLVSLGLVAGAIIVLVSVQHLELGLFFLVAFTYGHVFEVAKDHVGGLSASLPFVVFLLALALLVRAPGEPLLGRSGVAAMMTFGAYGLLLLASTTWARDASIGLIQVPVYAKQMLVVLAVLALIRVPRTLVLVVWAIVGAALVLGGLTMLQHFLNVDRTFFGFAQPLIHEVTTTNDVARAPGPIGSPNAYAQMLVVAVPLALGRALHERKIVLRMLALAATIVSIAAIYLTFSRGGFVSLAVVVLLFLFRFRPRLAPVMVGVAVLALVIGSASGVYTTRLEKLTQVFPWHHDTKTEDPSLSGRTAFLHIGLQMWRDHPLLGVGYGNYAVRYPEYNRRVGTNPALGHTAHNFPVEVAAETGAVGLALWLFLAASALGALLTVRRQATSSSKELKAMVDVLAIALIGYLVTSLFIGGSYAMLYWLLLALCFSVPRAFSSVTASAAEVARSGARPLP